MAILRRLFLLPLPLPLPLDLVLAPSCTAIPSGVVVVFVVACLRSIGSDTEAFHRGSPKSEVRCDEL